MKGLRSTLATCFGRWAKSAEGFADHLGMQGTYYGALELGEKNLQLSPLHKVANGLRVSAGQLFLRAERSAMIAYPWQLMRLRERQGIRRGMLHQPFG
jgi:transcriptional regulator with XRE-family HTH domain